MVMWFPRYAWWLACNPAVGNSREFSHVLLERGQVLDVHITQMMVSGCACHDAHQLHRRVEESGQALSGGALLSVGSWVFMMAVFAGGYGMAYFIRRQWT